MNKLNSELLNLVTLALLALTTLTPRIVHADGGAVDTMNLTDEPGNWFRSEITGTPLPRFELVREWISKSTTAARARAIRLRSS